MFYQKGVDVSNAKSMFNFLVNHFTYDTMSSWNGVQSVANNVKVYNLKLEGDCWQALNLLEDDSYEYVNDMLDDWHCEHKNYEVGFNGRSGGYLVMYNEKDNRNILPDWVDYDYEEFKRWCKDYYGSVKNYMSELKQFTKLVQSFDKLCDEIRDYVNGLSKVEVEDIVVEGLENAVYDFNYLYEDDLRKMKVDYLDVEDCKVNLEQIQSYRCLTECFTKCLAANKPTGYKYEIEDGYATYKEE